MRRSSRPSLAVHNLSILLQQRAPSANRVDLLAHPREVAACRSNPRCSSSTSVVPSSAGVNRTLTSLAFAKSGHPFCIFPSDK
ncbi:MAG: hypothetical protein M3O31_16785 [Acidobacteriota bacterium]|nr:hypothetical protein [Acidobacteriota bacterium]